MKPVCFFKKVILVAALSGFFNAQVMSADIIKKMMRNTYIFGCVVGSLTTAGAIFAGYKIYQQLQKNSWEKAIKVGRLQAAYQEQQMLNRFNQIVEARDTRALLLEHDCSSFERFLFMLVQKAICQGKEDTAYRMLEILLEKKIVDVNMPDQQCHNQTPLMVAAFCSGDGGTYFRKNVMRLLLDNGADISLVDDNGMNALDLAILSRTDTMVAFLMKMSQKKDFDKAYSYLYNTGYFDSFMSAKKELLIDLKALSEGDYSNYTLEKCAYFIEYPLLHERVMNGNVLWGKDILYVKDIFNQNLIYLIEFGQILKTIMLTTYTLNSVKLAAFIFVDVYDSPFFSDELTVEINKKKPTLFLDCVKDVIKLQKVQHQCNKDFFKNLVALRYNPVVDVYWRCI